MQTFEITPQDLQLVEAAKTVIAKYYILNKHHVGAAVLTKSGKTYAAVHLEATVGRIAVCAEAIAMGKAISEGENAFDTIVAVIQPHPNANRDEIRVVSPCGMCRELISDYGEDTKVIFLADGQLVKCGVLELLPAKYKHGEA